MTANETKFVAEIKALLAKGKVAAPKYFEVGKLCGLKCKEVVDAKKAYFSGETKSSPAPQKSKPAKKLTQAEQDEQAKINHDVIMNADLSNRYGSITVEDNSEPAPDFGIVTDTPEAFVWIASPEEIENPTDLHATTY
jgi:hypothetical protein